MSTPSIRFWNGFALGIPFGMAVLAMLFMVTGVKRDAPGRYAIIDNAMLLDSASGIVYRQAAVDNVGSRYWYPYILK
jgi:hypothetical protein